MCKQSACSSTASVRVVAAVRRERVGAEPTQSILCDSSLGDVDTGDSCAFDDAFQLDAAAVTLVQGCFPCFFPYHVIHNLLGGHYSRSCTTHHRQTDRQCMAAPFTDSQCTHGSHPCEAERPERTLHALSRNGLSCIPSAWLLLPSQVPRGSLAVGSAECQQNSFSGLSATEASTEASNLWLLTRPQCFH